MSAEGKSQAWPGTTYFVVQAQPDPLGDDAYFSSPQILINSFWRLKVVVYTKAQIVFYFSDLTTQNYRQHKSYLLRF